MGCVSSSCPLPAIGCCPRAQGVLELVPLGLCQVNPFILCKQVEEKDRNIRSTQNVITRYLPRFYQSSSRRASGGVLSECSSLSSTSYIACRLSREHFSRCAVGLPMVVVGWRPQPSVTTKACGGCPGESFSILHPFRFSGRTSGYRNPLSLSLATDQTISQEREKRLS